MYWSCLTTQNSKLRTLAFSILLIAAILSGCGPTGPKRYEHWGTVTHQGRPIPAGLVYFEPDVHAGNDGPQGQAVIKDGKYDTRERENSGPGSGKYVIRVQAFDGVAGNEAPIGKALFAKEPLIKIDLPANDSEQLVIIPPESR